MSCVTSMRESNTNIDTNNDIDLTAECNCVITLYFIFVILKGSRDRTQFSSICSDFRSRRSYSIFPTQIRTRKVIILVVLCFWSNSLLVNCLLVILSIIGFVVQFKFKVTRKDSLSREWCSNSWRLHHE